MRHRVKLFVSSAEFHNELQDIGEDQFGDLRLRATAETTTQAIRDRSFQERGDYAKPIWIEWEDEPRWNEWTQKLKERVEGYQNAENKA